MTGPLWSPPVAPVAFERRAGGLALAAGRRGEAAGDFRDAADVRAVRMEAGDDMTRGTSRGASGRRMWHSRFGCVRNPGGGAWATPIALVLVGGCGPIVWPKPAEDLPALARAGERARPFSYWSEPAPGTYDFAEVDVASGKPLVVIGAVGPFAGEMLEWYDLVRRRMAASRAECRVMLFLEKADVAVRNRVLGLVGRPVPFLIDRDGLYPRAYGFAGEGPHVAVIGGSGALVAVIDGPVHPKRTAVLERALDEVLGVQAR